MTTFTIQNPVDLTATHPDTTGQHIFLTEKQAAKALFYSPVHFRNGVKSGLFPQPVKLSERKRFWIQKELEAFVQNAIDSRGGICNQKTTQNDCFGLCPVCHSTPEIVSGRDYYFCVCHEHKVCWLKDDIGLTAIEILQRNEEVIKTYREVEPYFTPRESVSESPFWG